MIQNQFFDHLRNNDVLVVNTHGVLNAKKGCTDAPTGGTGIQQGFNTSQN